MLVLCIVPDNEIILCLIPSFFSYDKISAKRLALAEVQVDPFMSMVTCLADL